MIPRQWYIRLNSLNTTDYPYMEIPVDLPYLSTFSQDTESNILNVMIVNNGELMQFPDYVYVLFTIDKPDATQWIQAGEVVRDGHVRVGLNYQALSALGVANVTVKVYTDAEIVTMPSFQIKILADPLAGTDGSIESTSEYPVLSNLINAVQYAGENEQARIDAELLRDSAESQRVVAETARADAEIIRIANENTRIANENNRNVYEAWNSATTYAVGNKVVKDGSSYLAINASTNISPPNASYWLLIASKGDKGDTGLQGEQGIQGEQGMQGPQGVSIVSVIRTSGNGAAGTLDIYTITYSDATTSTFQVYNGADGLGAGDMLKNVYDTDGDGKVNSADSADSVAWSGVTGKPSVYPPDTHNHTKSQITDFPASLPADGGDADTVNGLTVETAVPVGAVFTDDQTASEVPYTNTTSGLTATTVQEAIDEIDTALDNLSTDAVDISITDTGTLYDATNVETALAEVMGDLNTHKADGATISELGHIKHATLTATVTTTWTGSAAPYSQTITVTGILATDNPIIDIVPTGTYETDVQMESDWASIYRIVTSADAITMYSHDITVATIPIQLKVVR